MINQSAIMETAKNKFERKESLEEKVNEKVAIIMGAGNLLKMVENNNPDEIERAGNNYVQNVINKFPPQVKVKYSNYNNLLAERDTLINKMTPFDSDEDWGDLDDEIEKANPIADKLVRVNDQIIDLELDKEFDDIQLIKKVDDFYRQAAKKRRTVLDLEILSKQDKKDFFQEINQYDTNNLIKNIDEEELISAKFDGINVDLILRPECFNKNIYGAHLENTPINLVKQRVGFEKTLNHEQSHNLYESFLKSPEYREITLKKLDDLLQRIVKLDMANAPQSMIDNQVKSVNKLMTNYTSDMFSEVAADLENVTDGKFSYLKYILDAEFIFSHYINQIKKNSPENAKTLENGLEDFKDSSVEFFTELPKILWAVEQIDKYENFRAAIFLFGQKGLRKADRYLRQFNDYEKYKKFAPLFLTEGIFAKPTENNRTNLMAVKYTNEEKSLYTLVNQNLSLEGFIKPKNITRLNSEPNRPESFLKKTTDLIIDEAKYNKLMNALKNINYYELFTEEESDDLLNLDYIKSYRQGLESTFDEITINGKKIDIPFNNLFYYLADIQMNEAIKNQDFTHLEAMLSQFPNERGAILESIKNLYEMDGEEWSEDSYLKEKLDDFLKTANIDAIY